MRRAHWIPLLLACTLLPSRASSDAVRKKPRFALPSFLPQLGDVYPFEPTEGLARRYPITAVAPAPVIDTRLEETLGLAIVLPGLKQEIIFQCWLNVTCCISSEASGCTDFIFACEINRGTPNTNDGGQTGTCTY